VKDGFRKIHRFNIEHKNGFGKIGAFCLRYCSLVGRRISSKENRKYTN